MMIRAKEPPNTKLSFALPVAKQAIKITAPITINKTPKFCNQLFMCVFNLMD